MENTHGQMAHFMRGTSMRTSKHMQIIFVSFFQNSSYWLSTSSIFVLHRLDGQGTFTDVRLQVWYGNFTHKAAPGLKFKLNM